MTGTGTQGIILISSDRFWIFLPTIPRRCFFWGSFLLFVFYVCHVFMSVHCSFALLSPAGKWLVSWLTCM